MNQIFYSSLKIGSGLFLAQIAEEAEGVNDFFRRTLGPDIWGIVRAIVILIIGWIVALIIKGLVEKLLKQTNIDNRIAAWITGNDPQRQPIAIEKWTANIVFWIVMLFVIIAVLNSLQLEAVSTPLNAFLSQIASFVPQIAGAALLLGLAWILATVAKALVTRSLQTFRLDERVGEQLREDTTDPTSTGTGFGISNTIGNAIYWLVFLLFIPAILSTLQLEGTLGPVQSLLNDIIAIVPRLLGALLIGVVGWFIAQIVRKIVTNLLRATGINRVGANFGLSQEPGGRSLAWIIGTIVYVLILIPTAIAALDRLNIESISGPATAMLEQVLNIIPQLFSAILVLVIAYIIAKYVGDFVTEILRGLGFDNVFEWLGIAKRPTAPTETPTTGTTTTTTTTRTTSTETTAETTPEGTTIVTRPDSFTEQSTFIQDQPPTQEKRARAIPKRTPSELVGIIVVVAIMLVAALTAVDILQIEALRNVVGIVLVLAGRVLLALIVLAIGLYLANFAFNFIVSSATSQSRILAQSARIAIIILATTMALQQLGIAPNIINLAFGLLLGSIAVAIALAFGLGARDVAGEQVREWLNSFKNQ